MIMSNFNQYLFTAVIPCYDIVNIMLSGYSVMFLIMCLLVTDWKVIINKTESCLH